MTFDEIAAGYANALIAGLGLPVNGTQLVQPAVLPADDASLWDLLDRIPPPTLYRASGATDDTLFDTYQRIIGSLRIPAGNRFLDAVGPRIADDFVRFLDGRSGPPPAASLYPGLFRSWALLRHPAVAVAGSTALAGMILEPLGAAAVSLLAYRDGRPPDWAETHDDLVTALKAGTSRTFSISSGMLNATITGELGDPAGLWAAGDPAPVDFSPGDPAPGIPASAQEVRFAEDFRLDVTIGHVLLFRPSPGPWYSSAALGIAHDSPATPPWSPDGPLDRERAFAILHHVAHTLIVADAFDAVVTAPGPWTQEDQELILDQQRYGLWPLYLPAVTECAFDDDGALTIRVSTEPGVPALLGLLTLPIAAFLGR